MSTEENTMNTGTGTARATETATLAGGCFWGVEEILRGVPGIIDTDVGYTGGWLENPTYHDTHDSKSGHAESIRVQFDPSVLSYESLLENWFFKLHDPTTLNRQGNDTGTQYRSAIFTHTLRQKELAERYKAKIDAAQVFAKPVVTEIVPLAEFYPAEREHQSFYSTNPRQGYCRVVIQPKLDKLQKVFANKWK